jgi:GTP:adenosylcobinamide-phosphate guanylyltransferase
MSEAFDNQFKPTTKSLSPMVKKSPARQAELLSVAPELAKQSLTEVAKKSFVSKLGEKAADAAVTTGVNMIGGALTKNRKKERRQTNTPTMNQNFGSTNIA